MKLLPALRWLLVPIVAVGGCTATSAVSGLAGHVLDTAMPLDVREGLVYAVSAIVFVVAGTIVAPRLRPIVALALYATGACVAWFALNPWWFPEHHPRAYELSRVPFILTVVGGLIGVLIILLSVPPTSNGRGRAPP